MRDCICFLAVASICATPSALSGQSWVYEQVEGLGNWDKVEVEVMNDRTVCVCYRDSIGGSVWLARKDTVWHRECVAPGSSRIRRCLVPAAHSRPALLLTDYTVSTIRYAVETDSGWVMDSLVTESGIGYRGPFLAFDSLGAPTLAFLNGLALVTETRRGEMWVEDTVAEWHYPGGPWEPYCSSVTGMKSDSSGSLSLMWVSSVRWTGGCSDLLCVATGRPDTWTTYVIAGGSWISAGGLSFDPGGPEALATCYNEGPMRNDTIRLYVNGLRLDDISASLGLIRVDGRNLRQVVYRTDRLKYAYESGEWHIEELPGELDVSYLDFAVDQESRPLIAYVKPDGIFLATGDAVGICERETQVTERPLWIPAVVRGVLDTSRESGTAPVFEAKAGTVPILVLLDATGRAVLDLKPGPNDVSRLAPGVYFVTEQLKRKPQAQAVGKVVIQR